MTSIKNYSVSKLSGEAVYTEVCELEQNKVLLMISFPLWKYQEETQSLQEFQCKLALLLILKQNKIKPHKKSSNPSNKKK